MKHPGPTRLVAPLLLLLASVAGCASVKSTHLHRNATDTGWRKNHMKGIPITLDVPTHARFSVIERYFLVDGKPLREPGRDEAVIARDVRYDLITERKIFTVDMKRPAAGPYQNNSTFENQYFKKIDHRLEDQTIEKVGDQINTLVGHLLPLGGVAGGAAKSTDFANSNIVPVESTVCSAVFKLDAPDFEYQVAEFLRANCGPLTPAPAIDSANRTIATLPPGAQTGGMIAGGGTNVGVSGADGRGGNSGPSAAVSPPSKPDPIGNRSSGSAKPAAPNPAG